MITVPTLQVAMGVIITLFLMQVVRKLTDQSSNPLLVGVHDGLAFLTS